MRIHRNDLYEFFFKPVDKGTDLERGLKLTASFIVGLLTLGITHAIIGGLHHRQMRKIEKLELSPLVLTSHQVATSILNPQTRTPYNENNFNISPLHPENFLMEQAETFSTDNNLAGFRAETVSKSDYTQANGPHTDDMTSYTAYPDGTCLMIVTDGEGGSPASDSFSHFINYRLHEQLDRARPEFTRLLKKGDEEGAKALAEKALSIAFIQAREDHKETIAALGGDLDHDENELYQGATTVAALMSIPDPTDHDRVWTIGVNVFDSPTVLFDPATEEMIVQRTDVNCNLPTIERTYEEFINRTRWTNQFSIENRPANSLMMVMSDGVTDNFPDGDFDECLKAIMQNSYFDRLPVDPPPENLTPETLSELGGPNKAPTLTLTPYSIRRRVLNFTTWRTRQARELADAFGALLPHTANSPRLLRKRGEFATFIYEDKAYLVQPKENLDEFLEKMNALGHDTSAFNGRAMDQEAIAAYEASQHGENPHRLQFEEGKQFAMIEREAFYDFLDQHFEPQRKAFGGKPDGASLIVGLAISWA